MINKAIQKARILPRVDWPKRLLEIPEPPKELWIRGSLPDPRLKWLTVVGSRKYTKYGEDLCRTLISSLSGKPVVIVSGLAIGMDSIALEAALKANIKCIAVPGSGISDSSLSPQTNVTLANNIINRDNCCLLSEFHPDTKAALWTFPRRNRIMAGLSHAVLIIEAEQRSGTLITARLATEYNRDVLTIPGSVFSKNTSGPHMLIKLGATPITNSEDLFEALGLDSDNSADPKVIDEILKGLTISERLIMENLSEPKTREILSIEIDLPQNKLNEILMSLELKGLIKESGGYTRLNI